MAFKLQTADGLPDANSYSTPDRARRYWATRGNLALDAEADSKLEALLIQATDYLDLKFRFSGKPKTREQSTQWPRSGVSDAWPVRILDTACAILVKYLVADAEALTPVPAPSADLRGVISESKTVGSISISKHYDQSILFSRRGQGAGGLPDFPEIQALFERAGFLDTASGSLNGAVKRG